jgi:dephospho-CoA kinase
MIKIGLTGNIGSGKTLVCKAFETLGVAVFYADLEAKKILNSALLRPKLIRLFGLEMEDKTHNCIDTKKLATVVFNNKTELDKLNKLIHPQLQHDFENWCLQHTDKPYVIQEAAILFENGFQDLFDKTIVVVAPKSIRLQRLLERDKSTEAEILARMNNQWSDKKKEKAADFIIHNDGKQLLLPQIVLLHQLFLNS